MFYDPVTYNGFIHCCIKNMRHNNPHISTQPYKKRRLEKENEESATANDEEIRAEVDQIKYLRPIDPEIKDQIVTVMEKSMEMRQAWVINKQPTCTEILDIYPHFKDIDGLVRIFFYCNTLCR